MLKLKITALPDEKPVKITLELPAAVHRDLVVYAEVLARETEQPIPDPLKLVAPMLARFMATDRAFVRARRRNQTAGNDGGLIDERRHACHETPNKTMSSIGVRMGQRYVSL
jgi:hypothetical protein